jgi:hypothetical protein
VFPVLTFNPEFLTATTIWSVTVLGNQTLKPEFACLAEQVRPDLAQLKLADENSIWSAMEQSFQICLAHRKRKVAQIIALHCQDIESAELHFIVVLAGMKRIEIRDPVNAEDDSLAIDHELTDAVFQGGFTDPRKAARLVIATPADHPHAVAVTLDANAIAIQLYFMKPFRAGGNLGSFGGNAELKRF